MTTVGQAANHHCIQKRGGLSLAGKLPSKKQRPLPASIATPVTDESSVVSKRMMADIPDMPDLLYTAISKAFAGQYSQACGLHSLHVASLANVCRLSVAQPLDPHVGDCFAWPGEPNTIACIVAFAQRGKVHVTPFCRRPLALAAKCAFHPEGGGCWRCTLQMKSQVLKVPESFDRSCVLVPRVEGTGVVSGPRCVQQTCFQLLSQVRGTVETGHAAAAITSFMEAAVEEVVQGSVVPFADDGALTDDVVTTTDIDGRSQVDTVWTDAVRRIYSDVVTATIDFIAVPMQCTRPDGTIYDIMRRGSRHSRLLVSSNGCKRLICNSYYCKAHQCRWNAPDGSCFLNCTIVGDMASEKYLIHGGFWSEALTNFQETESYRSLERMLRGRPPVPCGAE